MRDATKEPRHPLRDFLAISSASDKACDVPHRRASGLDSSLSHANLSTDIPACYHRCHNSVAPRSQEAAANCANPRWQRSRIARAMSCRFAMRPPGSCLLMVMLHQVKSYCSMIYLHYQIRAIDVRVLPMCLDRQAQIKSLERKSSHAPFLLLKTKD